VDWLAETGAVVALLLLRLGVPVLFTLLVSYLLSRLDAKWKAERAAYTQLAQGPRCWEIRGCDAATCLICPAYKAWPVPCWITRQRESGRVPEACFTCKVFLSA
jgi:hypothetical protein